MSEILCNVKSRPAAEAGKQDRSGLGVVAEKEPAASPDLHAAAVATHQPLHVVWKVGVPRGIAWHDLQDQTVLRAEQPGVGVGLSTQP